MSVTSQFLNWVSERDAIIKFLKTAKNRTRPSYDEVILAFNNLDNVPNFVKIVKRHKFYD